MCTCRWTNESLVDGHGAVVSSTGRAGVRAGLQAGVAARGGRPRGRTSAYATGAIVAAPADSPRAGGSASGSSAASSDSVTIACTIRSSRSSPSSGARAPAARRSRARARVALGGRPCAPARRGVSATRRASRSPSWSSTSSISAAEERQRVGARPGHPDVGGPLLVARAVGALELDQPVPGVERAGRVVALEHPEAEAVRAPGLDQVEQRRADALPGARGDVQVVQPVAVSRAYAATAPPTSATQTSSCRRPSRQPGPRPRRRCAPPAASRPAPRAARGGPRRSPAVVAGRCRADAGSRQSASRIFSSASARSSG